MTGSRIGSGSRENIPSIVCIALGFELSRSFNLDSTGRLAAGEGCYKNTMVS